MKKNLLILIFGGGLYCLNRLWLQGVTAGALQWFLRCYFSDILAGLILPAIVNLLLHALRQPPLRTWPPLILLLLGAGLVWECLAPLWKSGAVFDWWDFPAYQLGGLLYVLIFNGIFHQNTANNQ